MERQSIHIEFVGRIIISFPGDEALSFMIAKGYYLSSRKRMHTIVHKAFDNQDKYDNIIPLMLADSRLRK